MRFHPPGHADVSSSVWPGFCFNLRRSTVRVNTRLILIVFALLLLPLLIAARPMQADPPDLTNLDAVLAWLAGLGGPYFVGWVLSLVAENVPAWHKLRPAVKFVIPLIVCPLVSVGATLLLQQDAFLQVVAPWFQIVMGSILGWLGTQMAYMAARRSGYAYKIKWPE
jgi:hypothetical protein